MLREEMKKSRETNAYRRMEAVALRGEGKKNKEIGSLTGFHPDWVSKLVSRFRCGGLQALAEDGRQGGNHQNLTDEQEKALLKEFYETAVAGQVITPADIKKRYDELLGRETAPTFIYAVLQRNEWRKVMPSKRHRIRTNLRLIPISITE